MPALADIKHLIIDMDGVLYHGDRAMPMLCEFFAFLRERPIPFILATNNSTRTPQEYADKLARMGVQVSPAEVLHSGQAAARFLAREYPTGTRVHVFGMPSLKQALTDEGFVLADRDVELVVASMDRDITYEKLKRATEEWDAERAKLLSQVNRLEGAVAEAIARASNPLVLDQISPR